MSAPIDPENHTTLAYRGALRLRWSRLAARADEIRAEIAARGFGEAAARSAAIEAIRPDLRAHLAEVLSHTPHALLRAHAPRLLGWQLHVEPFLASDSVLLRLIDGALTHPVWPSADTGDLSGDDARWATWCAAWLSEVRARDPDLAAALAGAASSTTSAAKPTTEVRVQDNSGIPTVVKQGLDLINWLSNGMAGAHEARRQRIAREADRQRPLLVDDVLANAGATIPRLDQMVGVLMKDPVECKRVADMIAGQSVPTSFVIDPHARPQPPSPEPTQLRARDFMPEAFFARMAAERAAAERAAAERAAAERRAAERAATQHTAATAPATTHASPPSGEIIDAQLDALRLHVFTRQGDFEERMSRAEQKLALVNALHEKAQSALKSLRDDLVRLKSSAPSSTTDTPTTPVDSATHHRNVTDTLASNVDDGDDGIDDDDTNTDDTDSDDTDANADINTTADPTTTTFDAIVDELSAPATPTTAHASSPSPDHIRAAKLSALAAHFDLIADANDARLDAIERAADTQLQNAIALLAALENLDIDS